MIHELGVEDTGTSSSRPTVTLPGELLDGGTGSHPTDRVAPAAAAGPTSRTSYPGRPREPAGTSRKDLPVAATARYPSSGIEARTRREEPMRLARALTVPVRVALALRLLVSFSLALSDSHTRGYEPADDEQSAEKWGCESYNADRNADRCPVRNVKAPMVMCNVHQGKPIVRPLRHRQ